MTRYTDRRGNPVMLHVRNNHTAILHLPHAAPDPEEDFDGHPGVSLPPGEVTPVPRDYLDALGNHELVREWHQLGFFTVSPAELESYRETPPEPLPPLDAPVGNAVATLPPLDAPRAPERDTKLTIPTAETLPDSGK